MKKRKVYLGIPNHCYQRTVDRMVIFYTVSDYLLYFTIYCTTAVKYQVQVLKLSLMPDHIHQLVTEGKKGELSSFQKECHSRFAREYNRLCHRSGHLFEHHFGSAAKYDTKAIRTNLLYLDNNPVERKLAVHAEDYQWNFLSYGASDHPFSERIVLRDASRALRGAMKEVQFQHGAGRFLPYAMLQRLFRSLPDNRERAQLTDYIVCTYSIIDHAAAIRYFGSYEEELLAAHATAGGIRVHDFLEQFEGESDACYRKMTEVLRREGKYQKDIHEIFALPEEQRLELFRLLRRATSAPTRQIAKFLHFPPFPVL